MMKNWLSALLMSFERAAPRMPRVKGVGVEFSRDMLAAAAHAGARRVAGLRHETIDHAVEFEAVVKALAHRFDRCARHASARGPDAAG